MSRIGIYLGTESDSTDNIETVLRSWNDHLSDYEVETFGSAALPDSVENCYPHLDLSERRYRTPFGKLFTVYQQCLEYIKLRSPDVLFQLWKYTTHASGVAVAGKHAGIPTAIRLTGHVFDEYKGYDLPNKLGIYILNNIFGLIPLRLADHVIVLGPNSADMVADKKNRKVDVDLLPPPRPVTERFQPVKEPTPYKRRLGLDPDRPVALYVGRLTEQKGMPFLEEVIRNTLSRTNYQFLVVGDGTYHNYLEQRFSSKDLRIAGFVPYSQIDSYYKAANVYIHPSPYEGIPLVILEALASGVPVIAREAGDISFLTPNIVRSTDEMVKMLCRQTWRDDWCNREYFEPEYQRQVLADIFTDLIH